MVRRACWGYTLKFCTSCGAENSSSAAFCQSCGARFEAPVATPVVEPTPSQSTTGAVDRSVQKKPSGCGTVVTVVFLIFVGASLFSKCSSGFAGNQSQPQDISSSPPATFATDQAAVLQNGDTIGGLKYNISDVRNQSSVESFGDQKAANGEFIVLQLTVSNVGSKAADVNASDFHLKRGDKEFDEDTNVTVDGEFFLEKINPGTSKSGVLVFDVPANTSARDYSLEVYGNGAEGSQDSALISLP